MLFLFLFLVVAASFSIADSTSMSKDDDALLLALDKELEDFLSKAIDDLPRKLGDDELQSIEGSGELNPIAMTTTSQATHEGNINNVNTTVAPSANETASEDVDSEAVLAQLLSSVALAAQVPLEPSMTKIIEKLLEEATKLEIDDILANSTGESSETSPPTTTATTTISSTIAETSTSTAVPTTTTRAPLKAARDANRTSVECIDEATCYADTDCGQKGQCPGVFLGKCNCHACVANVNCDSDSDCGGLRKACQNGVCRCAQALAKHGFPLYIDALTKFCSQRSCTETSDSCFGLPCGRGICSCK